MVLRQPSQRCGDRSIFYRLNENLDHLVIPYDINRQTLEAFLDILEYFGNRHCSEYWLLMARLAEAALLLAGHYANNCETAAAGDVLIQPRPARFRPNRQNARDSSFQPDHVSHNSSFLPYLHEQLTQSQYFQENYLNMVWQRMQQVADTLGFLAAWQVAGVEELYQRLAGVNSETTEWIDKHLCHFERDWFEYWGQKLRMNDAGYFLK